MQILTRIHPGEVALSFLHFPDPNLRKVMHACPRTAHTQACTGVGMSLQEVQTPRGRPSHATSGAEGPQVKNAPLREGCPLPKASAASLPKDTSLLCVTQHARPGSSHPSWDLQVGNKMEKARFMGVFLKLDKSTQACLERPTEFPQGKDMRALPWG